MPNTIREAAAFVLTGLILPVLFFAATGTVWPVALWFVAWVAIILPPPVPRSTPADLERRAAEFESAIDSHFDAVEREIEREIERITAQTRADFPELRRGPDSKCRRSGRARAR